MNWNRLRQKVLEENYPGKKDLEAIREKYREIAEYIEEEFNLETHLAGSAGRETCMKDDRDIDIFVLFPEEASADELERRGLEIGRDVFKEFKGDHHVEYAEHPYVKGEIDGYEVEIVPCYDTDPEDIKSSVDRTPHHSRWVQENLNEKQREDVVVLKKFLEAEGIYGSSLKTRGFSGYLCEVLVSHYGGFKKLAEEASEWGERKVIDPGEHHGELPEKLEKKFENDPLTVIDPVDPERNVAAVMSTENYSRFIYSCWKLLEDPGIKHFQHEKREFTDFELKQEVKKRADIIVLEFENMDEVEDIVYPQMRKTMRRFEAELENRDFKIFNSGFHIGNQTRIFFEIERELPEIEEKKGPKITHGKNHLEQFTSKYDNVSVKEDRLVAKTEREFTDAKKFLEQFIDEDSLEEKGIPGKVAEKLEEFTFEDPLEGDDKWLNYLGEKFKVKNTQGEE